MTFKSRFLALAALVSCMAFGATTPTQAGQLFPPGGYAGASTSCPTGYELTWVASSSSTVSNVQCQPINLSGLSSGLCPSGQVMNGILNGAAQCTGQSSATSTTYPYYHTTKGYDNWNQLMTLAGQIGASRGRSNAPTFVKNNCMLTSDSDTNIWTITENHECLSDACGAALNGAQNSFMAQSGGVAIGTGSTPNTIQVACLFLQPVNNNDAPVYPYYRTTKGYENWNALMTLAGEIGASRGRSNAPTFVKNNCMLTSDSDANIWTITENHECMSDACGAAVSGTQNSFMAQSGGVAIGNESTPAVIQAACLFLQPATQN